MRPSKSFDCVAYKAAIQEKQAVATQGLSPLEKSRKRQRWLNESDTPAARLWREMDLKKKAAIAR